MSNKDGLPYEQQKYWKMLKDVTSEHKFWLNEPVANPMCRPDKEGIIKKFDPKKISLEPLELPEGFEWDYPDINDAQVLEEITDFYDNHYIKVNGNLRIQMSKEIIFWFASSPGYKKGDFVLTRNSKNKKIMTSWYKEYKTMVICGKEQTISYSNLLCVHSKLREKRMASL
jgi:hypothetical protein